MNYQIKFNAYGHPSISAKHKTTLMLTKDNHLTTKGDCIVGINAEKALFDMPETIKRLTRKKDTVINFSLKVGKKVFKIKGKGHHNLNYSHKKDIVLRKSNYTCNRTLMVNADYAACDIPAEIIKKLQNNNQKIQICVVINCDT
jgi:hypothetical protein